MSGVDVPGRGRAGLPVAPPAEGGRGGSTQHGPTPQSAVPPPATPPLPGTGFMDVLLVEDDAGDALLVSDLLADADPTIRLRQAQNLAEAERQLVRPARCILLDLNLPDADGLEGLERLLRLAPETAIIVLTGLHDVHRGTQAVAAGAQDYLNKGEVDGPLLARAIRYAAERQETHRFRLEAELRQQENARLERGLLPVPVVVSPGVDVRTIYRPGRRSSLLGGDFYDLVETPDGTLHAMIGDVCGHGPDEAALGVCLRVAWRTLVVAGHTGVDVLRTMQAVLERERRTDEIFATVGFASFAPNRMSVELLSAGHPPPLLASQTPPETARQALASSTGPALGLAPGGDWAVETVALPPEWAVLLFTDGLIEGRVDGGSDRLGPDGLVRLADERLRAGQRGGVLLSGLVTDIERLNGGAVADDIAVLYLAGSVQP